MFSMQSLARLLAFGFANAFLEGQLNHFKLSPDDTSYHMSLLIDKVWRFVAGFGGVFAILAIGLRWTMPESPRWVRGMPDRLREALATDSERAAAAAAADAANQRANQPGRRQAHLNKPRPAKARWLVGAYRWLRNEDHLKTLAVTGMIWFLLDVCFYGTGLDSPTTLNLLWLSGPFDSQAVASASDYKQDPGAISESIFWVLDNNGGRALEVSSISSIVGSLLIIPLINYLPRKVILFWSSLVLGVIFFITGILVFTEFAKPGHTASLVFFSLAQFTFNVGPNTIIFVLAAEIFPSMFRGTFYGLVAACGKAGALLIRPFLQLAAYQTTKEGDGTTSNPLGAMLVVFGFIMLAIACITKFWSSSLPAPQFDRGEEDRKCLPWLRNRHLESISPDPKPGELSGEKKMANTNLLGPTINAPQTNGRHANPEPMWVEMDDVDPQAAPRIANPTAVYVNRHGQQTTHVY